MFSTSIKSFALSLTILALSVFTAVAVVSNGTWLLLVIPAFGFLAVFGTLSNGVSELRYWYSTRG